MSEGQEKWLSVENCSYYKKGSIFNPCPRSNEPKAPCGGGCRPTGSLGRKGCEHYICGSLEMVLGECSYNGYKNIDEYFEIKIVNTYVGEQIEVVTLTEKGKKIYQNYKKTSMAVDESGRVYLSMVDQPEVYHLNRELSPSAKQIAKNVFGILRIN